jgi:hypothetical protein
MGNESPPMLSWDELQWLYGKASVAFLAFFFAGLADCIYHLEHNPFRSLIDAVILMFIWILGGVILTLATVEVLYWGKVRMSARFHLKRLGKNLLLILFSFLFIITVTVTLHAALYHFVNDYSSTLLALLMTCLAYAGIMLKLEDFLRRYYSPP